MSFPPYGYGPRPHFPPPCPPPFGYRPPCPPLSCRPPFGGHRPPCPPPFPPAGGEFRPVHVESVRRLAEAFDRDNDGALSASEASLASIILQRSNPNVGQVFGKISSALRSGTSYIDLNGDGKLGYIDRMGGAISDELNNLSGRSGNPWLIESRDFEPVR